MITGLLLAVLLQPPQVFFALGWTVAGLVCSQRGWKAFWKLFQGGGLMLILGIFALSFVASSDPNGLDYGFAWWACTFYFALTFPVFGWLTHLIARNRDHTDSQEAPE